MQNVSESWKALHNQQLLNESFVEVSFDIGDPDSIVDASSSDNGSIYIANTSQVVSEVDKHIVPYATLEQNLWVLNGSREFIPESDYGDTGYIGDELSLTDGTFTDTPTLTINFTQIHIPNIPGITITWSEEFNEYAEDFRIVAYNGSNIVADITVNDNTSAKTITNVDIANYNKIDIEIIKWCLPHHRPRITEVFVGIKKVYSKTDITKYSHEMNVSPIGKNVPMNRMNFSIDNIDNEYDPNNETGLSKYLMQRQLMKVKYGFKLDNGSIEYIQGGKFYLSEWDSPQNGITANFVARDLLEFMNKTYTKGLYSPSGTSLYSLAIDVLNEANLPLNDDGNVKWSVSTALQNIYTTAPLPMCSLAECLQYIAQAGCCVMYCDRNDVLHIEPINNVVTDYQLGEFNMLSRPEMSLQKPVRSIETKVYKYHSDETGKELFNGEVAISGTKTLVIAYSDSAINVSASVIDGTLDNATYYTNACHLTITATGYARVYITGDVLKSSTSNYVIDVSNEGETQTVDNPLINFDSVAYSTSQWVKQWLMTRKILKLGNYRADPRLDPADIIQVDNKFSTDTVRTTSIKYTYTGSFKATGEGRVITNVDMD